MTTAPVEVKKQAPVPTTALPDVWQSFRGEMDRVFDRFAGSFGLPSWRRMFDMEPMFGLDTAPALRAPAIDIHEDAAGYTFTAELPGMTDKDVEVLLRGNVLTLKGEKRQESEKSDKNVYLSERSYGAFSRSFTLPEGVDTDKMTAAFANGVLTLTVPKLPESKATMKTIPVKAAA